jgi:hypothetical protein
MIHFSDRHEQRVTRPERPCGQKRDTSFVAPYQAHWLLAPDDRVKAVAMTRI